jgi:hypothetical protein
MSDAPSLTRRLIRILAEIVVGLYVSLDFVVGALFRPLMRWLSSLRLIQRLEAWIGSLSPYVLLILLVVPFAIAELAKAYAVFLMGSGHFKTGLIIFIGAYVVTILVCERILSAGKAQLMTIGWFATLFTWVMGYKDLVMDWLRATQVWRLAADLKRKARLTFRRVKIRLGMSVGEKPSGSFGRR